jgi:CubicO group peptidase (beta-lactamase class C family)
VRDLATFVAAHLQRGADRANPIPLAVRTLMTTPRIEAYTDPGFRTDIGLGWFRETRLDDDSVIVFHTGEVDGHTAGVLLDPARGVGVVVLQNLGGDMGAQGIEHVGRWLLAAVVKEVGAGGRCSGS